MKFLSTILIFILFFIDTTQAQTRLTEPVLDMRIARAKKILVSSSTYNKSISQEISVEKVFSDSLAFDADKAELKEDGVNLLNRFIIQIDEDIQNLRKQYPTAVLLLKIRIVQDKKIIASHRVSVIYNYLIERLVQAGNIQVCKEIIKEKRENNQVVSAVSLGTRTGRQR
jgi:hypothetical protein